MPANTMISEVQAGHPVLEAVAEFREILNRLIDEQKALLLNRSVELEMEEARASSSPPSFIPTPVAHVSGDSVASHGQEFKPGRPALVSNKPKTAYHPTNRSSETLSPATLYDSDDANSSVDQRDPRQRLDALARLLDKRLKQSGTNPAAQGTKRDKE